MPDLIAFFQPYLDNILGIILTLVLTAVLMRLGRWLIEKLFARMQRLRHQDTPDRRIETVRTLVLSLYRFVLILAAGIALASLLGLKTALMSLLSAAGIGGLIIGLGAQDMIGDCLAGVFMLMDDSISVGDFIEVSGYMGTVEAIYLRVTHLRAPDGALHILPNGSISQLTNRSRGDAKAIVELTATYDTDYDAFVAAVEDEARRWCEEHRDIVVGEPMVMGPTLLGESSLAVRLIVPVRSMTHWGAERELRRRMLDLYRDRGFAIPYPHVTIAHDKEVRP